jgi:hypothetical protein
LHRQSSRFDASKVESLNGASSVVAEAHKLVASSWSSGLVVDMLVQWHLSSWLAAFVVFVGLTGLADDDDRVMSFVAFEAALEAVLALGGAEFVGLVAHKRGLDRA